MNNITTPHAIIIASVVISLGLIVSVYVAFDQYRQYKMMPSLLSNSNGIALFDPKTQELYQPAPSGNSYSTEWKLSVNKGDMRK